MSVYYGQVSGSAGTTASRRGTSKSGLRVSAQSWKGSVIVIMKNDEVYLEIADGSSMFGELYFCGTIEELKEQLAK